MNKPDDIDQWAWDEAVDLVQNAVDADWTWDCQAVGRREEHQATIAIAKALMRVKVAQREADAQLVEHYIGDLIYCERIVTAILKGGE
jgi:hypothetical protein